MVRFSPSAGNPRLRFIVLTACLALAVVCAGIFVLTNLDHDCMGEHCAVCLQIEIAQNLLAGLGRIGIGALAAYPILQLLVTLRSRLTIAIAPHTLVALKVKYSC